MFKQLMEVKYYFHLADQLHTPGMCSLTGKISRIRYNESKSKHKLCYSSSRPSVIADQFRQSINGSP